MHTTGTPTQSYIYLSWHVLTETYTRAAAVSFTIWYFGTANEKSGMYLVTALLPYGTQSDQREADFCRRPRSFPSIFPLATIQQYIVFPFARSQGSTERVREIKKTSTRDLLHAPPQLLNIDITLDCSLCTYICSLSVAQSFPAGSRHLMRRSCPVSHTLHASAGEGFSG